MRVCVIIWIALSAATAAALLAFDPRYYVMPNGRLADGLPVLGTEPAERILVASAAGLIVGSIVVAGGALFRAIYRAPTSNDGPSNTPLEPTPKDGAAQRPR